MIDGQMFNRLVKIENNKFYKVEVVASINIISSSRTINLHDI